MTQSLHFDVVFLVSLSLEERRDVSALMKTCHALYAMLIPRLLEEPAELDTFQKLHSLHGFLQAEPDRRFPLLRDLHLHLHWVFMDDRSKAMLLDILRGAVNLRLLDVSECERLLEQSPLISECVVNMTTLEEIRICNQLVFQRTMDMIHAMRSPVTSLTVKSILDPARRVNLKPIAAFRDTLKTIHVGRMHTLRFDKPYPCVRKYTISEIEDPDLTDFPKTFPNLRQITHYTPDPDSLANLAHLISVREDNQEGFAEACWNKLDHLEGDMPGVFVLGLQCPVRAFTISHITRSDLVSTILATSEAQYLTLSITKKYNIKTLIFLLPQSATINVISLTLDLSQQSGPMASIADNILTLLRSLPLVQYISLTFSKESCINDPQEASRSGEDNNVDSFRSTMERFARVAVAVCSSTLRHLFLDVSQSSIADVPLEIHRDGEAVTLGFLSPSEVRETQRTIAEETKWMR